MELNYISFDVETTGFGKHACVVEIAFVRMDGGMIAERFSQLLQPDIDMDDEGVMKALEINGITQEMLLDQPSFKDMEPAITKWLAMGLPWLGHNLSFDIRMLDQEYGRLDKRMPACPGRGPLDTMLLDLHLNPGKLRRKLNLVADRWGVKPDDTLHRAMADVNLTVAVFEKMRPRFTSLEQALANVESAAEQWDRIVSRYGR